MIPVLEPVHVLELDRASMKMEVVRINPTRHFAHMSPTGAALFTWQNGHWFGTGGQWIENPDDVPEAYRQTMAEVPVIISTSGPAVVAVCEFCGAKMNRAEKEAHLIEHVRKTMADAGTPQAPAPTPAPPPEPPAAPPPARERSRPTAA